MKSSISFKILIVLTLGMLLLTACDGNTGSASDNSDNNSSDTNNSEAAQALDDKDSDHFWQIRVNDSSTVTIGQVVSTTKLDINATNPVKGVIGHYTGSGSGETFNSNSAYGSTSQAAVQDLQWDFAIEYPLAPLDGEDDRLAPLVPDEEDDSLAPLVPSEEDALAPLDDSGKEAEYQGAGTMSAGARDATVTGAGTSTSKKLGGTSYPFNIDIFPDKTVKLELKTPQGSVFFDGELVKMD